MTYFCPALDPPRGGSGRKTTTLVRDLEYFIHTKFHQNPSSGSGEEVENVNSLTDGRTDDNCNCSTSKQKRMELVGIFVSIVLSLLIKSVVSLMYVGELITKSFNSCSATSAIRSVGVFVPPTIVLNGASTLCNLGFPFNFPFFGYFGMRHIL